MREKRRLRNYLIAPKQQIVFGFYTLIFIFLVSGAHTLFLIKKIRTLYESGQFSDMGIDMELAIYALKSFGLTILVLGSLIFLVNIMITHRIFGSLYAIEKYFKNAAEGKIQGDIPIRENDMTASLVKSINEYLNKKQG